MTFFFTGYINTDCSAWLVVDVLKSQALVLRADHLIGLGIMSKEFRAETTAALVLWPA
jgi:hypothetical protein